MVDEGAAASAGLRSPTSGRPVRRLQVLATVAFDIFPLARTLSYCSKSEGPRASSSVSLLVSKDTVVATDAGSPQADHFPEVDLEGCALTLYEELSCNLPLLISPVDASGSAVVELPRKATVRADGNKLSVRRFIAVLNGARPYMSLRGYKVHP